MKYLIPLALILTGCFSNVVKDDFVRTHAAGDLQCSQEEVTVSREGDTNWTAEGCGNTQKYVCWTSVGMGDGTCQKN